MWSENTWRKNRTLSLQLVEDESAESTWTQSNHPLGFMCPDFKLYFGRFLMARQDFSPEQTFRQLEWRVSWLNICEDARSSCDIWINSLFLAIMVFVPVDSTLDSPCQNMLILWWLYSHQLLSPAHSQALAIHSLISNNRITSIHPSIHPSPVLHASYQPSYV